MKTLDFYGKYAYNPLNNIRNKCMGLEIQLATKKEIANAFRVTTRTIDRMMKQKKLPFIKLPGGYSVRFNLQDVKNVLNSTAEAKA